MHEPPQEPDTRQAASQSNPPHATSRLRGTANQNCFVCRYLHVLPFRRCRHCDLSGVDRCPTIKAGLFLMLVVVAAGVTAYVMGDAASRTAFVMTGLIAVILLLVINSYSNEQARARAQLDQLHRELAQQHEFLQDLSPLESLQACLDHIVTNTASRLRCRRVSIMLADESGQFLRIAAACGVPEAVVRSTRIPIGERISGQVFHNDKPIHVADANRELGASALPIDSGSFMSGPLLLSGMRWGNTRLGVLSVTEPIGHDDFSIDDEFAFSNICGASAVAIYNHMAIAKFKRANVEFLETLVNAIDARDPYTRGHSDRVSAYAAAIGRRLMLCEESLADLRMAGRLHDIGKIGMPDAILAKPTAPTEQEWQTIRRHTEIAAEMLAQASLVSCAIEAIRRHHERLDGSGYPRGLEGPEIPLFARIVGVADAFDAMTTARPYHQPLPVHEALAELKRHRRTKFDAACVDALVDAVDEGELADLLPAAANSDGSPAALPASS